MKEFWDDRYSEHDYAYGTEPNVFFGEHLRNFVPGSILLPADGEGRNGVFAAGLGWKVTSADLSKEGKTKALALARSAGTYIDYIVGDMEKLAFQPASFDAIALINAHFAANKKYAIHQQLDQYLKPGGILLLEAFRKDHLRHHEVNPQVGGPRELNMLYSGEELKLAFPGYQILLLEETTAALEEGKYHRGTGAVIRFIARKNLQINI